MSSRIEKIFKALGQTEVLPTTQINSATNSKCTFVANVQKYDSSMRLHSKFIENGASNDQEDLNNSAFVMDTISTIQQAEVVFLNSEGKLQSGIKNKIIN